jgi:hypothetical protein
MSHPVLRNLAPQLRKISHLANWMGDKAKGTLVEQELFDLNASRPKR